MSGSDSSEVSSTEQLQSLIADFLQAEGAGQPLDRETWLAQNASHADSLKEFLSNHDHMRKPAPAAPEDVTLPVNSPNHDHATLPTDFSGSTKTQEISVGVRLRYFGDYELLEEIARGGMGVVYKARQINLNRIVALKMILAGQLASPQDVQRFQTEAESAANLDHPRIVPIYEVGQNAGQHYFSMGFVDGKSLAQKIVDGPMAPRDAAEMLVKICEGIAYAHERGVIHRDLKPANILLDQHEQPKVTDFGLAKKLGSNSHLTGTGQILGTPSYMAPEQASGKIDEVGLLADIYSLGAILYCLVTGRPPFQAANPMDTLLQVLDKEPISPRQLNTTIPVDLETICLKCLNKEPHRRYSNAQELLKELGRFLCDEPILARPVGKLEQAWRWCKRKPLVAGLLCASLILTVGVIAAMAGLLYQAKLRGEENKRNLLAAQAATEREAELRNESRRKVVGLDLKTAERFADADNPDAAMLWYARAWQDDPDEARNEPAYRLRLGLVLQKKLDMVGLAAHSEPLVEARIEESGRRVLTRTDSGAAFLWDIRAALLIAKLESPSKVNCIALTDDGKFAITGGADGIARVWDGSTGRPLTTVSHGASIQCLAAKPGGSTFATGGGDAGVRLWDAATGQATGKSLDVAGVYYVMFSQDWQRVVTAADNGLAQVWDVSNGQALGPALEHRARDASERRSGVRFGPSISPDGKIVLTSNGTYQQKTYTLSCIDAESGQRLWIRRHVPLSGVYSQTFSPDGKLLLLSGSGAGARILNPATGLDLQSFRTPRECQKVALLGNDLVLTASTGALVQLWKANGQEPALLATVQQTADYIRSIQVLPDERHLLIAGEDGTARLFDYSMFSLKTTSDLGQVQPRSRVFSESGHRFAMVDRDKRAVRVIDRSSTAVLVSVSFPPATTEATGTVVALSRDGKWLATGDFAYAGAVEVWDIDSATRIARFYPHRGVLNDLWISDDGMEVAVCSSDNTARLWDARTGTARGPILRHSAFVRYCDLTKDARRMSTVDSKGNLYLWDCVTGYQFGAWKEQALTGYPRTWFADDGQSIYYTNGVGIAEVRIEPMRTEKEHLPAYLDLLTGYRIDSATESIDKLPNDYYIKDPERFLRAFQVAQLNRSSTHVIKPPAAKVPAAKTNQTPADVLKLNDAIWEKVRAARQDGQAPLTKAELESIRQAFNSSPRGTFFNTLGTAEYRMGNYEQAIAACKRSLELTPAELRLSGPHPGDLAILAMSYFQLGNTTQAKQFLEQFQTSAKSERFKDDLDCQTLARELEVMFQSN